MSKEVQHMRRSQFILTYGPGAIIESRNGPRIIPEIKIGMNNILDEHNIRKYSLANSRLKLLLKNIWHHDADIFYLPSNASLRRENGDPIYMTHMFPLWKVCYNPEHGDKYILHQENVCPVCKKSAYSSQVRFVAACVDGHLDEVPWVAAVHSGSSCDSSCSPQYLYWKTEGSSLSDIVVECPRCGCKTNIGKIYETEFSCTGRFPEKEFNIITTPSGMRYTEPWRLGKCKYKMKVVQRQSSSLRIPCTLTLLTIPDYDDQISNILQISEVKTAIDSILATALSLMKKDPCDGGIKNSEFINAIENTKMGEETKKVITDFIQSRGLQAFCEVYQKLYDESKDFVDFLHEEFGALKKGGRTSENFEMGEPTTVSGKDNIPSLDFYPIKKIRTVTVQIGYSRMPYTKKDEKKQIEEPEIISSGSRFGYLDRYWYPGFEGFGEGIFITFHEGDRPKKYGDAYGEWERSSPPRHPYGMRFGKIVVKPLFVWLHTLSHALIRAISIHGGYSSAALRERIYLNSNGDDGGILIYTTSPGDDGSMGGLVETVNNAEEILDEALESIKTCSNDPLCFEIRKTPKSPNGAACHSCLLISETSCEHGNKWLDRHIVIGDRR